MRSVWAIVWALYGSSWEILDWIVVEVWTEKLEQAISVACSDYGTWSTVNLGQADDQKGLPPAGLKQ